MDNVVLPPPAVPSCSITRDRSRRNVRPPHRYEEVDLVVYTLNVVEGIESSE